MPLVLESEGPRLEGVEGEVSELGGEEKPSWGEGPRSASRSLGTLARERGDTLGPSGLWNTGLGLSIAVGMDGGRGRTGWGNMDEGGRLSFRP